MDNSLCNKINNLAFFKSEEVVLFFGRIKVMTSLFNEEITNSHKTPFVFTILQLNCESSQNGTNKSHFPSFNGQIKKASLNHIKKLNPITFATMDCARARYNRFRYTPEGFDQNWIYVGIEHKTTYSNLLDGPNNFWTQRLKQS